MAIKAGQLLHVGNDTVVIDRIQTAGPGGLNIPTEKIYELGNYQSVGIIRDTPDLTFSLESLDVSTEIEALLLGVDPVTTDTFDLTLARAIDIASQFKAGKDTGTPFAVVDSVGVPYLVPDSISYRFGLRDSARQTIGLRGDSIYYNPGSTYVETFTAAGTAGETFVTAQPAYAYAGDGVARRVLCVSSRAKGRLVPGADYTETAGTITAGAAVATITMVTTLTAGDEVRVMYASPTQKTYGQGVHATTATKPAAVRGRDIDVYVGGYDPDDIPGSQVNRWTGVQSAAVDYRVNLDRDEEMGNHYAVANDYDVPTTTGSLDLRPRDPAALMERIRQIAGVATATEVVGPNSSVALPLDIVIKDANNAGATLKRIHVPDARFTLPGFAGRTQQKLGITMNFESDSGGCVVSKE